MKEEKNLLERMTEEKLGWKCDEIEIDSIDSIKESDLFPNESEDASEENKDELRYIDVSKDDYNQKDDIEDGDEEDEEDDEDDADAWWFKPLGIVCIGLAVLALIILSLIAYHGKWFSFLVPTSKEAESVIFDGCFSNSDVLFSEMELLSSSSVDSVSTVSSKTQEPIKVKVKINNIIRVYGASIIDPSYEVEGNVNEKELSKHITLTKAHGNDVGKYLITGTCDAPNLYDVEFENGIYTIIPREVTIQADDKESFVGEKLVPLTYTIVLGSIVNRDKVVELHTGADSAKAGTYDIVDKWKNPNYDLTVKVGKYTVKAQSSSGESDKPQESDNTQESDNPQEPDKSQKPNEPNKPQKKKSTIQILNVSSEYNGEEPIVEKPNFEVVSGELTKEELSPYISATKAKGKTVGDYSLTGSCSNSNWDVTVLGATYTITPRPLSVKADNKQTYEGDPLADLTYTVTDGSIVNGDNVISLSTNATSSAIGEYPINVNCVNPNYTLLNSENGKYRVKAKAHIPQDKEEEVGESSSSGPKDEEENLEPNKPTPSDPIDSETGLLDESEDVTPNISTP